MKVATKMAVGLVGLIAAISMGSPVQAAVAVNMGGSSAATPFASIVPVTLCDAGTATRYVNGDTGSPLIAAGKLITWVCHRTALSDDIVIRYSASGSSDGIKKLQQPENNALSFMPFLDPSTTTNCTGPSAKSILIGATTFNYNEFTGCTNLLNAGGSPAGGSVQVGWSDVGGSSFHQVGPGLTKTTPLDDSQLIVSKTAVVPFAFVLGNGVQRLNAAGTQVAGKVTSLSQDQIIGLLSHQVTDWRTIGLGTAPVQGDGSPAAVGTAVDNPSLVTWCHRISGSGTKATLDVTLFTTGIKESAAGSTDLTQAAEGASYFGNSTQDIRDCIAGNGTTRPAHRHAIGYMEADQAALVATPSGGGVGQGYVVKMDGYLANDATLTDPQAYLKCGKWKYWTIERFNTRNPASADANVVSLINAFFASANDPDTVAQMNPFWVAPVDMSVTKNADPGPLSFTSTPGKASCIGIN
jgi:hypothetical protein